MADIRAFYEELGLYYIHKQRDEVSPGFSDTTRRVFNALKCFLPIGDDAIDLSTLFDIVNYTSCKDLINSDELLARAVKQLDAAVEEISAVRDIAVKYLPQEDARRACRLCPEGAEARASVEGEAVSGCLCGRLSSQSLVDPANRIDLKDLA